jgi:hypothetical protein
MNRPLPEMRGDLVVMKFYNRRDRLRDNRPGIGRFSLFRKKWLPQHIPLHFIDPSLGIVEPEKKFEPFGFFKGKHAV